MKRKSLTWALTIIIIIIFATLLLLGFTASDIFGAEEIEYNGCEPETAIRTRLTVAVESFELLKAEVNEINNYKKVTEQEYEMLVRLANSEATEGTVEQMMNTVWCVFNRVESANFPNSIEKVIMQKGQFSVISDKRFYTTPISEQARVAVNNVLKNQEKHDGTFFMARSASNKDNVTWFDKNLEFVMNDGIHEYFREKE